MQTEDFVLNLDKSPFPIAEVHHGPPRLAARGVSFGLNPGCFRKRPRPSIGVRRRAKERSKEPQAESRRSENGGKERSVGEIDDEPYQ